jgi:hypothetical protein
MRTFNTVSRSTPARADQRRRGVASVMAMMYLMIFSALSLGFYAAVTTAGQVANNERTGLAAQLSAESGIQFLRYHLSALDIKAGLTGDKIFEEVYQQLATRLDGTANLGASNVGYNGSTITIPETGYVNLDAAGKQRFRIILSRAGDLLVAKVVGRGGNAVIGRGVEIKFQKANNATAIFNYGVASRGTVSTSGQSTVTGLTDPTKGSILSTNTTSGMPVSIMGKLVSGDISTVSETANVQFGSNTSIGGTSNTQLIRSLHIHKGVPEPRFPDIDTTVYAQYVKNVYTAGMTVLDNCVIPAGTGTPAAPLKLSAVTIRGVLYIEGANVIEFAGNTTIQGVIVTANNVPLNTTNNLLYFSGNVSAQPMSTLPVSYGDERTLTGAFIIAPSYRVKMFGNFGTVNGSISCAQFQMGGSAEGTVRGSIIQMADLATTIDGSADVVIASVGTTQYPAGVTFGVHYTGVPGSYLEVRPD